MMNGVSKCLTSWVLIILYGNGVALAETVSTSVEVHKVTMSSSMGQKRPLILPNIQLEDGVDNGDILCDSQGKQYQSGRDHCVGPANNGTFVIAGAPNAEVRITLPAKSNSKGGLRLDLYDVATGKQNNIAKFDDNGRYQMDVMGTLTVENSEKVEAAPLIFDFNVMAVFD